MYYLYKFILNTGGYEITNKSLQYNQNISDTRPLGYEITVFPQHTILRGHLATVPDRLFSPLLEEN